MKEQLPSPFTLPHWGRGKGEGWRGAAEPYPELGEGGQPGRKLLENGTVPITVVRCIKRRSGRA
jgi:hypothetical protein